MIVTSKEHFCNIKQCFGSMNCTLLLSQPFHKGVCTNELHPDVSQSSKILNCSSKGPVGLPASLLPEPIMVFPEFADWESFKPFCKGLLTDFLAVIKDSCDPIGFVQPGLSQDPCLDSTRLNSFQLAAGLQFPSSLQKTVFFSLPHSMTEL